MSRFLEGLNDSQKLAVKTINGPVQIDAIPGSGKSTTLTSRVAYMIENKVKPGSILCTTFTKKAADEMVDKLRSMISPMALMQITIGTTHSIGWKILSKEYRTIGHPLANSLRSDKFLINGKLKVFADKVKKSIIQDRTIPFDLKETVRDIPVPVFMKVIGNAKNEGKGYIEFAEENSDKGDKMEAYCEFYTRYEEQKYAERLIDSDDLLYLTWKLFKEYPDILAKYQRIYKYVLMDEAQDSNALQYELVDMIARPENNLFLVGDLDQSMYSFRGAKPEEFLHFADRYSNAKRIPLEDNYRSNPAILAAANKLIQKNKSRLLKTLKAHKDDESDCVYYNRYETDSEEADSISKDIKIKIEQDGVSPKDIAILYRTNAQSRLLEEHLIIEGLPYVIHGGISFYERKEIKDLVSYLQLAVDPNNDKAFRRVINVPSRYLGKAFMEKVKEYPGSHWEAIHGNIRMKTYERKGTDDFISLIMELQEMVKKESSTVEIIDFLMNDCYGQYIKEDGEDDDEGNSRYENIETLRFALQQYTNVKDFLDYIDKMTSSAKIDINGVQLLTIHKSKGMEYPICYVAGCSQGVLPHHKAIELDNIEEERRLMYVAMTRAESELYISSPGRVNGKYIPESIFIKDIGLEEREEK